MINKWLEYIASKAIIILSVLLIAFLILKGITSFTLTDSKRSSDKLNRDQIILETKLDSIQNIKIKTQDQDSIINNKDSSLRSTHLKFKKQIEDESKSINHLLLDNLISQQKKNEKTLVLLDIFEMCANIIIGAVIVTAGIGLFWKK
jgi:hypothetical protein